MIFDLRPTWRHPPSIKSPGAGFQRWLLWLAAPTDKALRDLNGYGRLWQGVKVRRWRLKHGPGCRQGSCALEMFLTTSHEFHARVNQSSEPQRNQRWRTLISVSGDQCNTTEKGGRTFWGMFGKKWKKGDCLLWVAGLHSSLRTKVTHTGLMGLAFCIIGSSRMKEYVNWILTKHSNIQSLYSIIECPGLDLHGLIVSEPHWQAAHLSPSKSTLKRERNNWEQNLKKVFFFPLENWTSWQVHSVNINLWCLSVKNNAPVVPCA